jgi:hypothetical protein
VMHSREMENLQGRDQLEGLDVEKGKILKRNLRK